MSVADDITEQQLLMQKLKEQQELQKLIQDEMDTQSLATTVPPALSQVTTKCGIVKEGLIAFIFIGFDPAE